MAKGQVRLSHLTFTLVLEELISGPSTARALAEHSGMHHRSMCKLLALMHKKKVVHVAGWDKDSIGRNGVRVYGMGPGKDAARPVKSRQAINRDYRRRAAVSDLVGSPWAGLGASNDSSKKAA